MLPKEQGQAPLDSERGHLAPGGLGGFEPMAVSLDDRLRELEANLIRWALHVTGGNKSRAAALLKVKRSTLGDRINRCGIGAGSDVVAV
ncbi:MAG TPA: helix-turn-helix domain-containing protein [Vicinamibacterales bacterium]|jgi:DNA-binding NtrC family response regulator|nr:helix-turn-helix domain-containing protein [Vicinamibacterales bacterium]